MRVAFPLQHAKLVELDLFCKDNNLEYISPELLDLCVPIARGVQADPIPTIYMLCSLFNTCGGATALVVGPTWSTPTQLFMGMFGQSGANKSGVFHLLVDGYKQAERRAKKGLFARRVF